MPRRLLALAALALALMAVPAAHAATATVGGSTLTFAAGVDEKTTVSIA